MSKIRLVLDIQFDNEPEGSPKKTDEEICKGVICEDSESIDGFEIFTCFPDTCVTEDFYLSEVNVVGKYLTPKDTWGKYIDYLIEWALAHRKSEYENMSPARYDEWYQTNRRNKTVKDIVTGDDEIYLRLPDDSMLTAKIIDDEDFPAIDIYLNSNNHKELICFAEYNPEREDGPEVCVGVYKSNTDDNAYYDSYRSDADKLMDKARKYIDEYCQKTFERDEGGDYTNLSKVGLAYTTTEDGEHEIQVFANLVDYKLETVIDDEMFREECFSDLNEMIEMALTALDFDLLVELSSDDLKKLN